MNSRFPTEPPADKKPIEFSDANTCIEWVRTVLAPLGLTVVVVEMRYCREDLEHAGPAFDERIGELLLAGELGHWDSMRQGDPALFFFHVDSKKLPAGLSFIKAKLEELGLLRHSKIGCVDPEDNVWRTFYPATLDSLRFYEDQS